uniref:Uncharacterized protein n=1 Tax=Mycolicibacterium sp. CBMA 213 TaxID=1968788 RepID=A0A343VR04_9MYCO|nr:hypothetical protein B5P44_p00033 [Mycolicibacterium sp. CBMA 213]
MTTARVDHAGQPEHVGGYQLTALPPHGSETDCLRATRCAPARPAWPFWLFGPTTATDHAAGIM